MNYASRIKGLVVVNESESARNKLSQLDLKERGIEGVLFASSGIMAPTSLPDWLICARVFNF